MQHHKNIERFLKSLHFFSLVLLLWASYKRMFWKMFDYKKIQHLMRAQFRSIRNYNKLTNIKLRVKDLPHKSNKCLHTHKMAHSIHAMKFDLFDFWFLLFRNVGRMGEKGGIITGTLTIQYINLKLSILYAIILTSLGNSV